MFCTQCGQSIPDDAVFCTACGITVRPLPPVTHEADLIPIESPFDEDPAPQEDVQLPPTALPIDEQPSTDLLASEPRTDPDATPRPARPFPVKGVLIASMVAVSLVLFGVWFSGRTTRQIHAWGRAGDLNALHDYILTDVKTPEEEAYQLLAWHELEMRQPSPSQISLEDVYFNHPPDTQIAREVIQFMGEHRFPVKDMNRLVKMWVNDTTGNTNSNADPLASYFNRSDQNLIGPIFMVEISRRYESNDLGGAIGLTDRIKAKSMLPSIDGLGKALHEYENLIKSVPTIETRIEEIKSEVNEIENEHKQMKWFDLSAVLVDRLVNIGDNVYEVATFYSNGYQTVRNETAILTCNDSRFSTKGRFTLTVRSTGMKTFNMNSGRSVELPTFEEVSQTEKARENQLNTSVLKLLDEVKELKNKHTMIDENLKSLNDDIKNMLNWQNDKQTSGIITDQSSVINNQIIFPPIYSFEILKWGDTIDIIKEKLKNRTIVNTDGNGKSYFYSDSIESIEVTIGLNMLNENRTLSFIVITTSPSKDKIIYDNKTILTTDIGKLWERLSIRYGQSFIESSDGMSRDWTIGQTKITAGLMLPESEEKWFPPALAVAYKKVE